MRIVLVDNEAYDPLYGREFPLHDLFLDFLNNPIERYIDPSYDFNNRRFAHFVLSSDKETPFEEYKESHLKELVNRYLQNNSISDLQSFHQTIMRVAFENFVAKSLMTSHNLVSNLRIEISIVNGTLKEIFEIEDIYAYCLLVLSRLTNFEINLNRCDNCGKFFIPSKRVNEKYCDNIFEKGKTCKEVGYLNKAKNHPVINLLQEKQRYTYNLKKNGKELQVELWREAAKHMRRLWDKDEISNNEFRQWIEESYVVLREDGKIAAPGYFEQWLNDSIKKGESNNGGD